MSSSIGRLLTALAVAATSLAATCSAFQLPRQHSILAVQSTEPLSSIPRRRTLMEMASEDEDGTGGADTSKRRRRKRKKAAEDPTTASVNAVSSTTPMAKTPTEEFEATEIKKQSVPSLAQQMLAQEQMMYDQDDITSFVPLKLEEDDRIAAAASKAGFSLDSPQSAGGGGGTGAQLEDLFDSREFLQRKREKQLEDQTKVGKPSSVIPTKTKIKRSDVKAYTKLLEMDPLADEDSSYFEDEDGIDIISALLGDVEPGVGNDTDEASNKSGNRVQKKTSFLGIGSGPLQVGHFIGALVVVLMAFVEYPGFPLTNLPDPLRGAFQGGLATIYGINLVLAVIAALSAPGRNQPALLWGAKTFAVGGIAYDQLMQIPTPAELEKRATKEAEMMKLRGRERRGRRQ